ncbi:MAG: DUF2149 domain-containing protein [Elusimicrobia bacterium]|nr:DUF2149 domain-containing protein [Elusimicrobiota bacterium]
MRYLKKRRFFRDAGEDDDPMSGVANLFDVGLVFIVGLFLALMTVYRIMDFFSETSEITIMKKNKDGRMEIISKKGRAISVERVTDKKIGGEEGVRLGTAYQLKDGRMVYVPDE